MQDATLQHADTFFMFTTIAVVLGIIILVVILYLCFKALTFFRTVSDRTYQLLDKTTAAVDQGLSDSGPIKKTLPFILPLIGLFTKGKKTPKKAPKK